MTISLAFLAPRLVQAAVQGRLPRGIGEGVQISRTRLSLVPSGLRSRQVIATSRNAEEPERVVQVVLRVSLEASSATSGTPHQPVPQTPFDVAPDEVVCLHDWPLVEVAAPTAQQTADDGHSVLVRSWMRRSKLLTARNWQTISAGK
jgi:hypothetical protein